ncbi:MAG: response regulator, partial [Bacteroidetes bacterium]
MKNILLIEDNLGDIRLTQEAFKEAKVEHKLFIVKDGEEALEFLRQQGQHQDKPVPDLVFLDLNLPRKDGREVLKDIKEDKHL